MKLPDLNLLIYAIDEGSPRHEAACPWLEQPCAVVVAPTGGHSSLLRKLLEPLGTGGNLASDAHLAALAIEHGAGLCSCNSDFARFEGLRWRDPLR